VLLWKILGEEPVKIMIRQCSQIDRKLKGYGILSFGKHKPIFPYREKSILFSFTFVQTSVYISIEFTTFR